MNIKQARRRRTYVRFEYPSTILSGELIVNRISSRAAENTVWVKENLWNSVDEDGDQRDTYMSRIVKRVLKGDEHTWGNCAFVAAVIHQEVLETMYIAM